MNEKQDYLTTLKEKCRELEKEVLVFKLCISILEGSPDMHEEAPVKGPIQRTLNGGVAKPRKEQPLKIAATDVYVPGRPTGPRGEYERHIETEDFNKKVCGDIYIAIIEELNIAGSDTGVPILYITEKLGANRNNGYYTAKIIAKEKHLAYVKYNKWPQRKGYIIGLMSRSQAHRLGLKTKEQEIKEESENGTRDETAHS